MLARVRSATLLGIEAILLTVECDLAPGIPQIHTIGLPDAAVRESADRVRAALRNSGFRIPPRRITINLAPADVRKQGAALDLAIALGILAASGELPADRLAGHMVLGELALDGTVRRVPGCLPAALLAHGAGLRTLIVPADNREEALAVPGPEVHAVPRLLEAIAAVRGHLPGARATAPAFQPDAQSGADLSDVRGQVLARRALEVAAAGGHHLLLVGPPGCGKTMLARRLPGILPPLTLDESIEITCVYSATGLLDAPGLLRRRPFRAPHHTISGIGLVGGGRWPRPGEVTLSHHGVLFLDEVTEFGRATLDVLRQPLEDGTVTVTRSQRTTRMPARFTLVAAMNPCPCGRLGVSDRPCGCTPALVSGYRARVSGPLLDRFDLQVSVPPLRPRDLEGPGTGESSAVVSGRIARARGIQGERYAGCEFRTNAALPPAALRRHVPVDAAAARLLRAALGRLGLSARAHDGILRVARTIADLEGSAAVSAGHVAEAVQYRTLDRRAADAADADGLL